MDNNGEYTLNEVPKYIEKGTYEIKYKVYINDNYTEYLGQKTLTIEDSVPYKTYTYDIDEKNKLIDKILPNTYITNYLSEFTIGYGYEIEVDYNEVDMKKLLFTGGKTRIKIGDELYRDFSNIVEGDSTGDGLMNSEDLLKLRQHLLGIDILSGPYFIASDLTKDNIINSADLLKEKQKILELNSAG